MATRTLPPFKRIHATHPISFMPSMITSLSLKICMRIYEASLFLFFQIFNFFL